MNRFEFYGNIEAYKRHRDELKHYGTIGQKWGVRKWQNPDGTFNEAGKERYFGTSKKKSRSDDKIVDTSGTAAALAVWAGAQVLFVAAPTIAMAIEDGKTTKRIKKYEENLATEETDPKTGYKLKNKELTTKEDMQYVNMEHKYYGLKQKNADAAEGTSNNCSLCTTAMVLRQRGYDVRASKARMGRTREEQEKTYKNGKFTNGNFKDIMEELKSQPDGSYGHFSVAWRDAYGGAHSMFYKIENGKPVIYDAQTNQIMKERDLYRMASPMDDSTAYMRCDNLEIDFNYVKENKLVR